MARTPREFDNQMTQYACAALTGMLSGQHVHDPWDVQAIDRVSKVAWKYAEAMARAAPPPQAITSLRRELGVGAQ